MKTLADTLVKDKVFLSLRPNFYFVISQNFKESKPETMDDSPLVIEFVDQVDMRTWYHVFVGRLLKLFFLNVGQGSFSFNDITVTLFLS